MGTAVHELNVSASSVQEVNVSAFYMDKYEVTKALWDEVRAWGLTNGYTDLPAGGAKAANHPVHMISWYEAVKWSNARSEKENLTPCYAVSGVVMKTGTSTPDCNFSASGYRLPTDAEWEKAARGGLSGKRFPWGDTITYSQANYYSSTNYSYDVSPTRRWHPDYFEDVDYLSSPDGSLAYSSPVGSFAPNGYGLYDMAGNMREWCWDPRGPSRLIRGGAWSSCARDCLVANWDDMDADSHIHGQGFRCARSSVP